MLTFLYRERKKRKKEEESEWEEEERGDNLKGDNPTLKKNCYQSLTLIKLTKFDVLKIKLL